MTAPGDFALIDVERDQGLLTVRINRPEAANALNTAAMVELERLFGWLAAGAHDQSCVILTGAGDKAFCAGGDLKERNGFTTEEWNRQHRILERAVAHLLAIKVPVIAAVNGAAYGGGCELALACDFAFASRTARFALPETSLGIFPGVGGTQFLARAAGTRRAKQLIFAAESFDAEQALQWGLLNGVCAPEALMPQVLAVARRICGNGPLAISEAKKAIDAGADRPLTEALQIAVEAYDRLIDTEDRAEGVRAFNEKRAPSFKGR